MIIVVIVVKIEGFVIMLLLLAFVVVIIDGCDRQAVKFERWRSLGALLRIDFLTGEDQDSFPSSSPTRCS